MKSMVLNMLLIEIFFIICGMKKTQTAILQNMIHSNFENGTNETGKVFPSQNPHRRSLQPLSMDQYYAENSCLKTITQHVKYDCQHALQANRLNLADKWIQANVSIQQCLVSSRSNPELLVFTRNPFPTPLSTVVRIWHNDVWMKIKVIPAFVCRKPERN